MSFSYGDVIGLKNNVFGGKLSGIVITSRYNSAKAIKCGGTVVRYPDEQFYFNKQYKTRSTHHIALAT